MIKPQVSVIIPVYNQEKYLAECLESVLEQKGASFEIIAINDGSTDRSGEILKRYQRHIILIEQENQGPASARNQGIKRAQAELIAFLDADDRYLPDHLAQLVNFIKTKNALLFYGDVRVIDEKGNFLWVQKSPSEIELQDLLIKNQICASSVAVRREVFEQELYFKNLHPVEDWELWIRIRELGEFSQYNWVGVEYRKHQTSAIKSKIIDAEEKSLFVLEDAFKRHQELSRWLKRKALSSLYYQSLLRFLASEDIKGARKRALLSLRYYPFWISAWLGLGLTLIPQNLLKRFINLRREFKKWKNQSK